MNEISPEQLLSQLRALGRELQIQPAAETPPAAQSFSNMLKLTLDSVSASQHHAAELKVGFESGVTDKSLAEVMIAAQKADLSFRAVTEVRNKLITAYQEIMNMPV